MAVATRKKKPLRPPVKNTKPVRPAKREQPASPEPKRIPRHEVPLTAARVDVLREVAKGPKPTSNITNGKVVSGAAATVLERDGLVKITMPKDSTERMVTITVAGTKALALSRI